jgi:hypothetical protein
MQRCRIRQFRVPSSRRSSVTVNGLIVTVQLPGDHRPIQMASLAEALVLLRSADGTTVGITEVRSEGVFTWGDHWRSESDPKEVGGSASVFLGRVGRDIVLEEMKVGPADADPDISIDYSRWTPMPELAGSSRVEIRDIGLDLPHTYRR